MSGCAECTVPWLARLVGSPVHWRCGALQQVSSGMGRTLSNPKNTPDMAATSAAVAPARLTSSCIACTAIVGGPGSAEDHSERM